MLKDVTSLSLYALQHMGVPHVDIYHHPGSTHMLYSIWACPVLVAITTHSEGYT